MSTEGTSIGGMLMCATKGSCIRGVAQDGDSGYGLLGSLCDDLLFLGLSFKSHLLSKLRQLPSVNLL